MSMWNDLAITSANSAMTSAVGHLFDFLQAGIANGGRDRNCKFYYNAGAGGSILQVAAKTVVGGAVSELKDMAVNQFNSLLKGKKSPKSIDGGYWVQSELAKHNIEEKLYGKMKVNDGKDVVLALDEWGDISRDALMLGIELDKEIVITQSYPQYSTATINAEKGLYKENKPAQKSNVIRTKTLVWYDTTALITINSDKNLVVTQVQGRDYSRKELISNGDIKFSVTGQITSGKPDIYPMEEMQKFYKVMLYKGIVKVNNLVLDQLGITDIVITDFNVSPREGYKAMQNYTFNAIGLQPESEIEIEEDGMSIIAQNPVSSTSDEGDGWKKMLDNQLSSLKSMAGDLFSQGAALATGMVDNAL